MTVCVILGTDDRLGQLMDNRCHCHFTDARSHLVKTLLTSGRGGRRRVTKDKSVVNDFYCINILSSLQTVLSAYCTDRTDTFVACVQLMVACY